MSKILSKEQISKQFKKSHNKYSYDWSTYTTSEKVMKIICPDHGEFWQSPGVHKRGSGCPKCSNIKRANIQRFNFGRIIKQFNNIHGDKYCYNNSLYVNDSTKLLIKCNRCDLEFQSTPSNHKKGHGCPKCNLGRKKIPTNTIRQRFIDGHGTNKFEWFWKTYVNISTKMKIKCLTCLNVFNMTPDSHQSGQGCPKCNMSHGERKVKMFLEKHNIKFEQEKTFTDCMYKKHLKFDFYLHDHNICIEFDGQQHFEMVEHFGGKQEFESLQLRDKIKNNYCFVKGIQLIRIPYIEFKNVNENLSYLLSNIPD